MGAEADRLSGLKLGETFSSVHGLVANANSKSYGEKYKVAGILKPVHGPYDQGIFVTMESIWEHHKHGEQEPAKYVEHDNDRDVTAVIIRPMGCAASMQLVASLLDSVSQRCCGEFIEKASSIRYRALQKS